MADTPDFNKLPIDTANVGKKISGVTRTVNATPVFIQDIRVANEAADPVLVGGTLLAALVAVAQGLQNVNTLAAPGVSRQLAAAVAGGSSANTALTTTCRRVSLYARLSAVRFAVGATAQTASATSHYIALGERLDVALPANANIAVLSDTTTAAVLEVTELL